ncbi:helix-turn-helix domain-containing protein [Nitrosospira sp. Is2]|uniref:helix-turn-helix domain-containing protein n=1 Tax=Nitrosospira sp. Is2 TaxID=3080532 RepID=UPI002952CC45|nr:helix-turn-helix domain-containing protein [Nitrosospira sp. Is2]WON75154.1 helix-turn-helix domain-containing protein [Nitrosospira sp. Is2]
MSALICSREIHLYPDGRLDTKNASSYIGLSEKTLAMMRCSGTGPSFIKRGRIFYFKEDLDRWLNEEGKFRSTAQAQKAGLRDGEEILVRKCTQK